MNSTKQFRQEVKDLDIGLDVRKRQGLEVLDILRNGTVLFSVMYAELYPVQDVAAFLAKKMPPAEEEPQDCDCGLCDSCQARREQAISDTADWQAEQGMEQLL
jgi:hypothetical protein